jgi:hypothetical protein
VLGRVEAKGQVLLGSQQRERERERARARAAKGALIMHLISIALGNGAQEKSNHDGQILDLNRTEGGQHGRLYVLEKLGGEVQVGKRVQDRHRQGSFFFHQAPQFAHHCLMASPAESAKVIFVITEERDRDRVLVGRRETS